MFSSSKRRGNARAMSARSPRISLAASRGEQAVRSAIETLESRLLMTTVTYTVTGNDDGAGLTQATGPNTFTATTLRAVNAANFSPFNSVINFASADFPGGAANQITLTANMTMFNATKTYTITGLASPAAPIVIDGNGLFTDFATTAGVNVTLNNLTIQHGVATVPNFFSVGGGGLAAFGPTTLNNDAFIGDSATGGIGGGVYSDTGNFSATNCSFTGDSAFFGGGIMFHDTATNENPNVTGSTFTGNTAVADGAAIQNESAFDSTVTYANDTFTGNASTSFAAVTSLAVVPGITVTTNVTNSTFTSNKSNTGGALFSGEATLGANLDTTTLNVSGSSFTNNDSVGGAGGGIFTDDQVVNVSNSNFTSNLAAKGSGIFADGSATTVTVTGSNFTNTSGTPIVDVSATDADTVSTSSFTTNTGPFGGGIAAAGLSLTATSDTFSHDTASAGANGGGINFTGPATSILTVGGTAAAPTTFTSDSSSIGNGGGIFSTATKTLVSNSTFTANSAHLGSGGAIANVDGGLNNLLTLTTDTFTGNLAPIGLGGAVVDGGGGVNAQITSTNSNYTNNTALGGGAISSAGSATSLLTVSGGTLSGNTATLAGGGAVTTADFNAVFTNDNFNTNQSLAAPGGSILAAVGNKLTVTGSQFSKDLADGTGGGIFFTGPTGVITSSTFTGETAAAASSGGAVFATAGALNLTGDTFTSNLATNTGGAVDASVSGVGATFGFALDVETDTFSSNSATNGGGGLVATEPGGGGSLFVANSTFNANTTNFGGGGGIQSSLDVVNVANSTFFANAAGTDVGGGGLALIASAGAPSAAVITDSTFALNSAGFGLGGGIANTIAGQTAQLNGTIVATNVATGSSTGNDLSGNFTGPFPGASTFNLVGISNGVDEVGLVTLVNHNIVGTVTNPINPFSTPPVLADNGGAPTSTVALPVGSAAIAKGANFPVLDINNIDVTAIAQNLVTRPEPQGWDIGAFEFSPAVPTDHFVFASVPATGVTGVPTSAIVIEAVNSLNVVDSLFSDTVSFSSTGPTTGLPANATFTNGVFSLTPTFTSPGTFTVTATDTTPGSPVPSATSTPIVISNPVVGADHLVFTSVPGSAIVGTPTSISIEALTPSNAVDTAFSDTVKFTSSDLAATGLPAAATFASGVLTFTPTFNTVSGVTTVTATDLTNVSVAPVTVGPINVTNNSVPVTPTVTIAGATITKPSSGTAPMSFLVSLSAPAPAGGVTVSYGTVAGSASSGANDYVGVPAGTLNIPAGASSGNIVITIKGNTQVNPPRTFTVQITGVTNANLGSPSSATGTINSSSIVVGTPAASINNITLTPANSGLTPYNFTVSLSSAAGAGGVSIVYGTIAGSASSGAGDYVGVPSATLHIAAGATSGQITIMVKPHHAGHNTFFVKLMSATGATILMGTGTGTIL